MDFVDTLAQLINNTNFPKPLADANKLETILNVVFATLGALAFFIMVLAGFRYVASQGDPTKVANAKNTLIYAAAGLIIVATAAIIVNFVMGRAT